MKPALQRSRHLLPGDKLGKYELIRQIAIGGMAELYLARTVGIEGFEKLVVVKRILPQFASSSSFVNMFLNEARLAATLHHPNIAQVYDIGVEDGDYFFAMEYVHGEDLDRVSNQSQEQGVPISLDAALALVTGLCAGLHYAHEKTGADGQPLQIVHRDVSPSNVLVSYDGSVKLVDFGIARAFTSKTTSTQGGLKGKITYMSPEQVRSDGALDRRSDIYSVGTLLYELTTGRTPFSGETEYAILNQIVNVDAPPPSRLVPGYPPALERIVLRALAREPTGRYATAIQLQGELEDFAHESRLRISPLVLARLMGTLFPARLEDWDNAKSQGAFFVEQHVVRTLIESGKNPVVEDDPTAIGRPPIDVATAIGPPPIAATRPATPVQGNPRASSPVQGNPRASSPVMRGSSPVLPRAATPQVASQASPLRPPTPMPRPATAGVLVSHPNEIGVVQAPMSEHAIATERVRALPRAASPTKLVHTGRRGIVPIVVGVLLLLVGGGAATFIALDGGGGSPAASKQLVAPEPKPAPEAKSPEPTPPPAPEPKPPEPTPEPAQVAAPAQEQPPAPEPKAEAKPEVKADPPPKPKKVAKKPPKKKADDPKPEEKQWNNDSVFMPVRTDKH